jgi:hypothetical protein
VLFRLVGADAGFGQIRARRQRLALQARVLRRFRGRRRRRPDFDSWFNGEARPQAAREFAAWRPRLREQGTVGIVTRAATSHASLGSTIFPPKAPAERPARHGARLLARCRRLAGPFDRLNERGELLFWR